MHSRRWTDQKPFQETWFIEALLDDQTGLWVRYVLDSGLDRAEVWAILTGPHGVVASHMDVLPLDSVQGPLFRTGSCELRRDRAIGTCGPIHWDLTLDDLGVHHQHVPKLLTRLGLGRTYAPAIADLRLKGTVTAGSRTWDVAWGPGVLGHIWGGPSRLRSWSWAHCNAFGDQPVVFEGIAAKLGDFRPLTSVFLHVDGHTYGFSRFRDVLRNWSHTHGTCWTFEAHAKGRMLLGELTLDPATATVLRYDRLGKPPLYCTNTRFGKLLLVFRDERTGQELELHSKRSAFEIVAAHPPGPVPDTRCPYVG